MFVQLDERPVVVVGGKRRNAATRRQRTKPENSFVVLQRALEIAHLQSDAADRRRGRQTKSWRGDAECLSVGRHRSAVERVPGQILSANANKCDSLSA
jgi:hypothetical protein